MVETNLRAMCEKLENIDNELLSRYERNVAMYKELVNNNRDDKRHFFEKYMEYSQDLIELTSPLIRKVFNTQIQTGIRPVCGFTGYKSTTNHPYDYPYNIEYVVTATFDYDYGDEDFTWVAPKPTNFPVTLEVSFNHRINDYTTSNSFNRISAKLTGGRRELCSFSIDWLMNAFLCGMHTKSAVIEKIYPYKFFL